MARPIMADVTLEVGNAIERGGRWVLDYSAMALVRLQSTDSGVVDDPFVKYQVDWGDGYMEISDMLPVARPFQFFHTYSLVGDYIIRIYATNRDGEKSLLGPKQTVSLRVIALEDKKRTLYKWAGIALPNDGLGTAVASHAEAYPTMAYTLGANATVGQFRVVLSGLSQNQGFAPGTEVTIFQPGKLITAARLINSEANVLNLDMALNDSYDASATIEIRQRRIVNTYQTSTHHEDPTWAFPTSHDEVLVKAALVVLLGTRQLERLMRPKLGSRLAELPFDPHDITTRQLAFRYSVDAISPFEPRVQIGDVKYEADPSNNQLSLKIPYRLRGSSEEAFEATIPLSLLNNTNV